VVAVTAKVALGRSTVCVAAGIKAAVGAGVVITVGASAWVTDGALGTTVGGGADTPVQLARRLNKQESAVSRINRVVRFVVVFFMTLPATWAPRLSTPAGKGV